MVNPNTATVQNRVLGRPCRVKGRRARGMLSRWRRKYFQHRRGIRSHAAASRHRRHRQACGRGMRQFETFVRREEVGLPGQQRTSQGGFSMTGRAGCRPKPELFAIQSLALSASFRRPTNSDPCSSLEPERVVTLTCAPGSRRTRAQKLRSRRGPRPRLAKRPNFAFPQKPSWRGERRPRTVPGRLRSVRCSSSPRQSQNSSCLDAARSR